MILDRTEKARRIVQRGGVGELTAQEIEYRVMGDRGVEYTVTYYPGTGEFTCTCPDHVYRERECKHIKAVKMSEGEHQTRLRTMELKINMDNVRTVENIIEGLVNARLIHRYEVY